MITDDLGWVILGKGLLGRVGWCGVKGVCRQYQYALGKQPLVFFRHSLKCSFRLSQLLQSLIIQTWMHSPISFIKSQIYLGHNLTVNSPGRQKVFEMWDSFLLIFNLKYPLDGERAL